MQRLSKFLSHISQAWMARLSRFLRELSGKHPVLAGSVARTLLFVAAMSIAEFEGGLKDFYPTFSELCIEVIDDFYRYRDQRTPRGANLLCRLLPKAFREPLMGDLLEQYEIIKPGRSRISGSFWLYGRILSSASPLIGRAIKKRLALFWWTLR
jgi:hypothetical protein